MEFDTAMPLEHGTPLQGEASPLVNSESQSKKRRTIASIALVLMLTMWLASAELLQDMQKHSFNKPLFMSCLIHTGYAIFVVVWGAGRLFSPRFHTTLPLRKLLLACFALQFVGTVYGALWYASLPITTVAANTTIYQSASVFVYVFSVFMLKERILRHKVLAVLVCVAGVTLVGLGSTSSSDQHRSEFVGYVYCFISTVTFALYEVLLTKYASDQRNPMQIANAVASIGLIGLFNFLAAFPLLFIFHVAQWETFEMPQGRDLLVLIASAVMDGFFNVLMLVGMTLTSPLFMSVGSMLIIPCSILADWLLHGTTPSLLAIVGSTLVIAGFFVLKSGDAFARMQWWSQRYSKVPASSSAVKHIAPLEHEHQ